MASLGLVVLRLALAVVFIAHGAHTLFGAWPGPGQGPGGLAHEADLYTAAGLTPAMVLAVAAGVVQFAGGLLIGVGWFARWAAGALAIDVGLGLWMLHLQWGFFLNYSNAPGQGHGIEYTVVLLGALLALVLGGAGDLSIDGVRAKGAEARAAGRARLRGKV